MYHIANLLVLLGVIVGGFIFYNIGKYVERMKK